MPAPNLGSEAEAATARPAYWLSNAPATATLWSPLQPSMAGRACGRCCSKAGPRTHSTLVDRHDAATFLAQVWADWAEPQ